MIRITALQAGFRRCGISHPQEPTEYEDTQFTAAQLVQLKSEPMLLVEVVDEKTKSGK